MLRRNMLRLIKPSKKYKKSFVEGRKEFQREEKTKKENIRKLQQDFAGFVRQMRDYEYGRNLPKGYVPSSYYWLMDGSEFIGETTVRHKLTKALLKEGGHIGYGIRPTKRKLGYGKKILVLALRKARTLGIKKVLITCDDDNVGSWKIIEANRGLLQNTIKHKGKRKRRYWIQIKNTAA